MDIAKEFDHYTAYLMQGLGHADRHSGLSGYCIGLMLPLSRKSGSSLWLLGLTRYTPAFVFR